MGRRWVVATNLWFYRRKDIGAAILVHAASNASILADVIWATGGVPGHVLWVFA